MQDIGDIELVSDLPTLMALRARGSTKSIGSACRSIYDYTVLWSLIVINGSNEIK